MYNKIEKHIRFCKGGKKKRNDCKDAMSDNSMQNDLHA